MNRAKWKLKKITRFYRKHYDIALGMGVVVICLILVIVATIVLLPAKANAKEVKEYLGKWYVSTYSPWDDTQNGYGTSSGKQAKTGRTCAVDMYNPLVPMGSKIYIEGRGYRTVEDVGGFGSYNNGRRAIDDFTDVKGAGGLWLCKIWLVRDETKQEKKIRIAKAREKAREKREQLRTSTKFDFVFDDSLAEWQIITDPDYISGGAVIIDYNILDVVGTEKGLGNKIKTGNSRLALFCDGKDFTEVIEEAVG